MEKVDGPPAFPLLSRSVFRPLTFAVLGGVHPLDPAPVARPAGWVDNAEVQKARVIAAAGGRALEIALADRTDRVTNGLACVRFGMHQNPNRLSLNLYRTQRDPNSLRSDPCRLAQKLTGLRHNPRRFRRNPYRFCQNPNGFPPIPFRSPGTSAGFPEILPTPPPRPSSHRLYPMESSAIVTCRNDPSGQAASRFPSCQNLHRCDM